MKMLAAAVAFAFTVGLAGMATVHASAFNDRGSNFASQVTPTGSTDRTADFAHASLGFTDRSTDLRNTSFAPGNADLSKVCDLAKIQGFNQREHYKQTC